jgi:guanylate kinase
VEGVNYYFVDGEEFERMIRDNELIEYAQVHGNWYGVPSSSIFNRINAGKDVTCVIDVQGAQKIREQFPQAFLVFIKPPAGRELEILAERITGRERVGDAELNTRLETATRELELVELYDATIVNDDLQRAAQELCDLIEAEKARRAAESN